MRHGTASDNLMPARDHQCGSRSVISSLWIAVILCSGFVGCVTPWEKSALMKDTYPNIARVQGPTERGLRKLLWMRQEEAAEDDGTDSLKPLAGTEDYLSATELYKDEEYSEAQKAFKRVAKKYKKSPIREDALFMQAEAAFQQEHYSKAHDTYAVLLKEFPSTRHLDTVSERLFKIGRIWLDFPEVASLDEIQQVNFEDPKKKLPAEEPPKKNRTPVFLPNFTNKQRPWFDTPGNGVAALQAIWMNDVTSPLADDAMMLVASHHARQSNYIEADRYFRMLRETYPNSPHLQDAFLIGSHVKLMSYQGADYDGKTLTDAEMLKESTLRLYPNIEDADRLNDELAKIEAAKAEREWMQIELWLRKGNKRAAAVMCHQLISHYPKSPRADQARRRLEAMGPEYVSGAVLLNPHDPTKRPLWQRMLPQSMLRDPETPTREPVARAPYAEEETAEEPPTRRLPNPFRRRTAEPANPIEEDSMEDESGETQLEPDEKAPKKRNWLWPIPRRLPDDADSDARKLEADE